MKRLKIKKIYSTKKENIFIILILNKIIIGNVNKVITRRLNENKPTRFNICNISLIEIKLYAHKFHGNPVSKLALKKSETAKPAENIKSDDMISRPLIM